MHSTAIGIGSPVDNANSVALGQVSVTDCDSSVSVGAAAQQCQITEVAAGAADTHAVNVGQLNSSVAVSAKSMGDAGLRAQVGHEF